MSVGFSTVNGVTSDGAGFGLFLQEGSENVELLGKGNSATGGGQIELNLNLNSIYNSTQDATGGLNGTYQLAIREVEFCDQDGNTRYMLALCSQPYDNSVIS